MLNALRPPPQPADLRRCVRRRVAPTSTWRCTLSHPHPEQPVQRDGRDARRRASSRSHEQWAAAGPLALVGHRRRARPLRRLRPLRRRPPVRRDRRGRVRDGANLVVEGLRLRADLLDLDDDRGVPQPAGDLGARTAAGSPPRRSPSPRCSSSPRASGRSSASTSSTRRSLLVPRWVDCRRVTFKYGLGRRVHRRPRDAAQARPRLARNPVRVRGVEVSPRDVVAACCPNPATLGDRMRGKTCAGTLVTGTGRTALRARSTSTTSPTTSGRCASTATRRSCGRPLSTRSSRSSCSHKGVGRNRRARPRGVPGDAVPRPARRLRRAARDGRGRPTPQRVARRRERAGAPHERIGARDDDAVVGARGATRRACPAARGNGSTPTSL